MIRDELKKLKSTKGELRKFGLVVGGVFALIAALFWWRGSEYSWIFVTLAAPLILLGAVKPGLLKWVYLAWMTLGLALGLIVSTVLLTLFYYLLLTPVGLLARLFGKDFLDRKIQPEAESYWRKREASGPKPPKNYEQQF
jgi:polyferredoxin